MLIISQWIFAIFATLLALSVGWWIALSSGDIKEFGRALVSWCMKPTKSRTKTDSGNMSQSAQQSQTSPPHYSNATSSPFSMAAAAATNGSSPQRQRPAAAGSSSVVHQDSGSVRSILATLGEEGPSLGALRAFQPPRDLSSAESAYGQIGGAAPLVHWSSGAGAVAGPSLDIFDEGDEVDGHEGREGECDQHSMYVSPMDTAFEVVLPSSQQLSGAGTAYQVEAEGKAISWLLELGAGNLPDGMQALVQVEPTAAAGLGHACLPAANSLLTWDAGMATFRASSLPHTSSSCPHPHLVSVLPAAILVYHPVTSQAAAADANQQAYAALANAPPVVWQSEQQQQQQDSQSLHRQLTGPSSAGYLSLPSKEYPTSVIDPGHSGGSMGGVQAPAVDSTLLERHHNREPLIQLELRVVLGEGQDLVAGSLPGRGTGAPPGAACLSVVLGSTVLPVTGFHVVTSSALPASKTLLTVKVAVSLPSDLLLSLRSSATVWAQIWQQGLLVSSLPVLLFVSPGASQSDMLAVAEVNTWATSASAKAIKSQEVAPPPSASVPNSRASDTPAAVTPPVLVTGPLSKDTSSNGKLSSGYTPKDPSPPPLLIRVTLQHPHPLLGYLSQVLPLERRLALGSPARSDASEAKLKPSPQDLAQALSEGDTPAAVFSFLTDLGSWRTYTAALTASVALHGDAMAAATAAAAALGLPPPSLSPGDLSEEAVRTRMVLMGLCLLRYAVRLGMRGVAAGLHTDMVEQPLHRRALLTLISATAAAGEAGGAAVEPRIARMLSSKNPGASPQLAALLMTQPQPGGVEAGGVGEAPPPSPLVDTEGRTLLHLAVLSGSHGMVEDVLGWSARPGALLSSGDWTSLDSHGMSPLHVAALLDDRGALASALLRSHREARSLWHMSVGNTGFTPAQLTPHYV